MKKIKRKLSVVFLILLAMLFVPGTMHAKTQKEYQGNLWNFKKTNKKTSGAFTYYAYPSKNKKEAWIYKIDIKAGKNCSKLSIPSKLNKKKVTRLGCREVKKPEVDVLYNIFDTTVEPWHPYGNGEWALTKRIKKLVLPKTVKIIQPETFSGMDSIQTVKIPKSVKVLEEHVFYHCDKLKEVELPAGLKSLDARAFLNCPKLESIKMPTEGNTYQVINNCVVTKEKEELVFAASGGQALQIPEGVKVLKKYAFSNCANVTVHIPASVNEIERDAFSDVYGCGICQINDVTVDGNNSIYARDGQCIYNKTDHSLSVAIQDEKGNLYISDQVERLTRDRNLVGPKTLPNDSYPSKVVYPKTLKAVVDCNFLRASHTYFKGENPPELVKEKLKAIVPPDFIAVYVPESSEKVYREWIKKYKGYKSSFHTFKSEDEI